MIVKILFSLITIIIPRKLYKVHSILKSDKGSGGGEEAGLAWKYHPWTPTKEAQLGWGKLGVEVRL